MSIVTWNPADKGSAGNIPVLSGGNLSVFVPTPGSDSSSVRATAGFATGLKLGWQVTLLAGVVCMGWGTAGSSVDVPVGSGPLDWSYVNGADGGLSGSYKQNGGILDSYGAKPSDYVNAVYTILVDQALGTIAFQFRGVDIGVAYTDTALKGVTHGPVYPMISSIGHFGCSLLTNFGGLPFVYPLPSGYTPVGSRVPSGQLLALL